MPFRDEGRKAFAHAGASGSFGDGHGSILRVCRQDAESAASRPQRTKMTLVERQDISASITVRENNDRCVRQADVQVVVGLNDGYRLVHVLRVERQMENAPCDLSEETQFVGWPAPLHEQVVEFC